MSDGGRGDVGRGAKNAPGSAVRGYSGSWADRSGARLSPVCAEQQGTVMVQPCSCWICEDPSDTGDHRGAESGPCVYTNRSVAMTIQAAADSHDVTLAARGRNKNSEHG